MKYLTRKLIVAGNVVTKRDLIIYVFGCLGANFQHIYTILKVQPEQYTLDEVQYHLQSYELKLEKAHSTINFDLSHKALLFQVVIFLIYNQILELCLFLKSICFSKLWLSIFSTWIL